MASEQRMNLDQELAELTDLTTRAEWTPEDVARVQEQLPKMLHDLRGYYAERRNASAARAEIERWKARGDALIAFLRAQGLTVREHGEDQEHWLTILPAGCKCERTVGDSPCPLHTLGVGDAD